MRKFLALTLALLLMMTALVGCGSSDGTAGGSGGDSASAEASEGNTAAASGDAAAAVGGNSALTIGIVSVNGGFDHVGTHGQSDDLNTWLAWGSLFRRDTETGEMVPDMVDTYEWVDSTHLKITLKSGITAVDGEEITAEDVLYSYQRYVDESSNLMSFVSQYDFANSAVDENDPLTLTMAFTEEFGPGISYMYMPIVPKDWASEGEGTDDAIWWDQPNSTGPYTCVENVDGAYVTFALRDDYWGDTSGMAQTITIKYYGTESTMYVDFMNGDLDACFGLSSEDIASAGEAENVAAVVASENDIYMLVLPEYVEQFEDENVRKAIAHAIDYEGCAIAGFGSLYTSVTSILPTSVNYSVESGLPYEYDPDLAKELMAQSAYPDGFDLKVVVTNSNENINLMTAIQAYLAVIGINVSVESYDIPTAVPMMQEGNTDLALNHGMGGNPQLEPAISLQNYAEDSTNLSVRLTDETFNTNYFLGLNSVDESVRAEAYEAIQEWAVEAYRLLPICESAYAYAYHTDKIQSLDTTAPSAPDLTQVVLAG